MHVDDDGRVVDDVVVQILEVIPRVPQFLYSADQLLFPSIMQPFTLPMHVGHDLVLQSCASVKGGVLLLAEELPPLIAVLIMGLLFTVA